jgi:hypothetical protein
MALSPEREKGFSAVGGAQGREVKPSSSGEVQDDGCLGHSDPRASGVVPGLFL